MTPPVVPANDDTTVGIVTNPNLDDLAEIMPEVAHSMKEILDYKGHTRLNYIFINLHLLCIKTVS